MADIKNKLQSKKHQIKSPLLLLLPVQIAEPSENDTTVVRPVLGYTPSGTVEGQLVYVNYGRVEDFETLENVLNVSVKGKIAFMRYGAIYRGDKVISS